MTVSNVTIAIADDHPIALAGLRTILSGLDFVDVVAEADDGLRALAVAREFDPDILLLDIEMPGLNGIQVTKQLKAELSTVKVIAISGHESREYVYGVLASGAAAFLMKEEATVAVLKAVVASVMRDEDSWISPALAHKLVQEHIEQIETSRVLEGLTARELEVLKLIAHGCTNREIADHLNVAEVTVRNHANHVRTKLDVHTRAETVVWAWERGVVATNDGVIGGK